MYKKNTGKERKKNQTKKAKILNSPLKPKKDS